MKDTKSETERVETDLNVDEIRRRIRREIVEGHQIFFFGLFGVAFLGRRHFSGAINGNQLELQYIQDLFLGSSIMGHVRDGDPSAIEFQTLPNVVGIVAPIVSGIFLIIGLVLGLILILTIPRAGPVVFWIWAALLGAFVVALIMKATTLWVLPVQHKRHKDLFETLLN